MSELESKTVLVADHGLFIPLAERLAESFGRVLYWSPYEEGFSTIRKACFGDGYNNIERCIDLWRDKEEVDLFVFPDNDLSGIQMELVAQGYPVWGSRNAGSIELDREEFLELLDRAGLEVPSHQIIEGIAALREHLKDAEDKYIKISKWRGDLETAHWRNWELDSGLLDVWGMQFGPVGELIRFLVFDAIDTPLEIGGDTYCVDGKWPSLMLHGVEFKDKAYFGAVTKREDMPEQIRQVLEAFAPIFEHRHYRNQFSSEVRVKGDQFWFIDPTCRGGLPSTGSQLALWNNFPEILWNGAHGVLVDPEPAGQFSMECVLTVKAEKNAWASVEFPESLKPWVKPYRSCKLGNVHAFPPNDYGDEIGWLVAIGDTPRQTLDAMKEHVADVPDGVEAHMHSLVDVIKEIESEEEQGIEFTGKPLPEPGEVIEH